MRIDIITVVPEMLHDFMNLSILGRAQKKGLVEIHVHNLRDYTKDKHRRVDDYPFGGFAGMVMQCQPIDDCIAALKAEREYDEIIFTSPDGEQFNQPMANTLSMKKNIIILCGHYMCAEAVFAISFFVPMVSKAISSNASPPIFMTDSTIPRPKAVCSTISPLFRSNTLEGVVE